MAVTVTAGARGEGANLSLELQRKLEEHWVDNYSRAMRVTLGVMNRAIYSAQDLFYSLQNTAPIFRNRLRITPVHHNLCAMPLHQ